MAKKNRVLVFDDDKDELCKVYIHLLLKNFEVEASCDPKEIGARLNRFKPNLVIVNIDVPGFNGSEICAIVKEQLKIPIILLLDKTSADTMYIDGCKADGLINKPIDNSQLINMALMLLTTGPANSER